MQPLLQLRNIRKYFVASGREIRAVDGVSLQVSPGEAVGLVGESGCGKSTLARCALRLMETTSGEIRFDGMDMTRITARQLRARRREFQMIFQDASLSLDPRRNIAHALHEPFRAHRLGTAGEREKWVSALLDSVGLDPSVLQCYPAQLSGGQQQRVAIARALALHPRLVVADEPVSALDASVGAQILNLLSDIRRRTGVALLVISHSLPVVRYLCDRVVVMYLGRIVEESAGESFFADPLHPYSRLLLQSSPGAGASTSTAQAVSGGETASSTGCSFQPRCSCSEERCAREEPRLETVPDGRKVSCFKTSSQ